MIAERSSCLSRTALLQQHVVGGVDGCHGAWRRVRMGYSGECDNLPTRTKIRCSQRIYHRGRFTKHGTDHRAYGPLGRLDHHRPARDGQPAPNPGRCRHRPAPPAQDYFLTGHVGPRPDGSDLNPARPLADPQERMPKLQPDIGNAPCLRFNRPTLASSTTIGERPKGAGSYCAQTLAGLIPRAEGCPILSTVIFAQPAADT